MLIPLLEVGRWAAMESCSICSQVLCLQRVLTKAALQLAPETKGNWEFTLEMPQLHWHHNKSETDKNSRFTIRHYTHKTICRKCLYYNTTVTGYIITPLTAYDPQPFPICKGYYLWIGPKTSCGYQTELVPHHQCLSRAGFNRQGLCSSSIGKFLSASTRELDTELAQPMWLLWELTHRKKNKSRECQITNKKE